MRKRNIILLIFIALFVVAIATCSYLYINKHKNKQTLSSLSTSSSTTGSASTSSNGGLNVSNGTNSNNLGQLSSTSQNGTNSNGSSQSGSASSSSNSNAPDDPANFAQYNKYASANEVYFGDIQVGTGPAVTQSQKLAITYKGWLTNGTLFSQTTTNSNGQTVAYSFTPAQNQVIPGLEQGVIGMKVGGTRLIIIPPSLGYGDKVNGAIPANSVLVFEVTILSAQ